MDSLPRALLAGGLRHLSGVLSAAQELLSFFLSQIFPMTTPWVALVVKISAPLGDFVFTCVKVVFRALTRGLAVALVLLSLHLVSLITHGSLPYLALLPLVRPGFLGRRDSVRVLVRLGHALSLSLLHYLALTVHLEPAYALYLMVDTALLSLLLFLFCRTVRF